ncbi:hypothetical protein [uncultured Methanobrevibacter sp.]|uniref:hypothetical protein n=1 Tax=uncultured Methanobrevibacter sp. TaxID=253161 RepID=UPI0025F0F683|nr:hypothetical protein [uncultured Methanobrevibacter sp.]
MITDKIEKGDIVRYRRPADPSIIEEMTVRTIITEFFGSQVEWFADEVDTDDCDFGYITREDIVEVIKPIK